jgi:DNA-binding transcriptional ArsR family regulator
MTHGVEGRTGRATMTPQVAERVADAMQALATPSRVLILGALRERSQSVSELIAAVGMQQSAVSHQLKLLRDIGLVVGERRGRSVVYSLYDEHVASLIDQAVGHVEHLSLGAAGRVTRRAAS